MNVGLLCENHLAGVIIDRFGKDVMMIPKGKDHFHVNVLVSVSPQFFGWITGVGTGIHIDGPDHVKQQYAEYLKTIVGEYQREYGNAIWPAKHTASHRYSIITPIIFA